MLTTAKNIVNKLTTKPDVDDSHFRVGTLIYSRAGLITLFSWLLFGDFAYTLMELVMPSLLPLVLRDNGASDTAIGFIVSSLYMMVNMIANPIISYKSDRFRSRWGRRRPFILVTTPFVVLMLVLIPFAPEITRALERVDWIVSFLKNCPITTLVLVSGILVAAFQVFNMFVASLYYYLIADVVPKAFIGRFYGLFRVFGASAGFIYNYFIFGSAKTHMHEIFIGIAIMYGIVITTMCLKVKEGEYPPPDQKEKRGSWWSGIRNYGVECFSRPLFWLIFLVYSIPIWGGSSTVFQIFLERDQLGFTLDQIGKLKAYVGVVSMIVVYPIGILVDRFGSHKSLIAGMGLFCAARIASYFLMVDYWSAVTWFIIGVIPWYIITLASSKWVIDLYPRKLYGQFSSAGAMVASFGGIILGPLCGAFLTWIDDYRYVLLWPAAFQIAGIWGAIIIYRRWRAMGGDAGYQLHYD